jgi:hypothetical protein
VQPFYYSPTLDKPHRPTEPYNILVDDSAEDDLWTPHGITYPDGMQYPPTPARSVSCFMQMCRLSVIFNQILIHMYDPMKQNTKAEVEACLDHEGMALKAWWEDLPHFLRIDTKDLPAHCPPSHIVTLKYEW